MRWPSAVRSGGCVSRGGGGTQFPHDRRVPALAGRVVAVWLL